MRDIKSKFMILCVTACLGACGGGDDATARPEAAKRRVQKVLTAKPYVGGTILPNHISAAERDSQVRAFYREWRTRYVVQECGDGRYFVKVNADHRPVGGDTAPKTITVSEAHGYGMLITVMMAAHDNDARDIFDGMVRYFHDHPAASSPHLMAWNQVEGCANSGGTFRGKVSATDGDLDIAYALLLADRQWGSDGAINYRQEAREVMQAILRYEVHPAGKHLMIGDWAGTDGDPEIEYTTRSSDFMQSHLTAFFTDSGDARWLAVRDRTYVIVSEIQQHYSPKTALMPDFIFHLDGEPRPAKPRLVGDPRDGEYSWNAARYPWRVGMDYLLYGEPRAFNVLGTFNRWARSATGGDPTSFASTYHLNGVPVAAEGRNSLAFVSALGVSAMINSDNQEWLNAIWENLRGQSLENNDYYGNTLKLLSMIVMSGAWLQP
ncbi:MULTISPECIES: glycosyl hydrolase family 8 [Paraburkholderia]|uniref:glycosyl hydrolase family 8 n=1 Tax=Paraburkholderia TaxID=1822464 RepID=UPI0022592C11|nr:MULTISPECIES: glycosyl hydrolase family 8 [Paraburkholderia]MCX4155061.1 glycosyl hydrolase family 8 [Paraburkholderia aspalathi]MDN7164471.1 glycosyl hydrolase family 8 [Paraburkholderia sp. SECH2]MDQ6392956.1 glycosyl hydrolase family 8 [Paraburkholderia aspalathi]